MFLAYKIKIMKVGEIKKVNRKGLEFELQATDEKFLVMEGDETGVLRQIGIVVTDLPKNEFGIKKGSKMLISKENKSEPANSN